MVADDFRASPEICRDFMNGRCQRGECKFLHPQASSPQAGTCAFAAEKPKHSQPSGRSRGRRSSDQHGKSTGPPSDALYRTKLCRNWQEAGHCQFAERCWFAHGVEELRQPGQRLAPRKASSNASFSPSDCIYDPACLSECQAMEIMVDPRQFPPPMWTGPAPPNPQANSPMIVPQVAMSDVSKPNPWAAGMVPDFVGAAAAAAAAAVTSALQQQPHFPPQCMPSRSSIDSSYSNPPPMGMPLPIGTPELRPEMAPCPQQMPVPAAYLDEVTPHPSWYAPMQPIAQPEQLGYGQPTCVVRHDPYSWHRNSEVCQLLAEYDEERRAIEAWKQRQAERQQAEALASEGSDAELVDQPSNDFSAVEDTVKPNEEEQCGFLESSRAMTDLSEISIQTDEPEQENVRPESADAAQPLRQHKQSVEPAKSARRHGRGHGHRQQQQQQHFKENSPNYLATHANQAGTKPEERHQAMQSQGSLKQSNRSSRNATALRPQASNEPTARGFHPSPLL